MERRTLTLALALFSAGCAPSSGAFSRGLEGGGLFGRERCTPFSITPSRFAPAFPAQRPASSACSDSKTLRARLESLLQRGHFDRALRLAAREAERHCEHASNLNDLVVAAKSALAELPSNPDVAIRQGLAALAIGDHAKARMNFDAALLALERPGVVPVVVAGRPDDFTRRSSPKDEDPPAPEEKRAPLALLRFSIDGARLVLATDDRLTAAFDLRSIDPPIVILPPRGNTFMSKVLALSADGTLVAQRAGDTASIVSTLDGREVAALHGHIGNSEYSEPLDAVSFFWDGARIATGDEKGTLRVFQRRGGAPISETFALRDNLQGLATSPDGRYVATSFGHESAIRIRAASGAATYAVLPTATDEILDIAWSAEGRHVAASALFGAIDVWDLSTCKRTTILDKPACHRYGDGSCGTAALFGMAISPDGSRIAGAFNDEGFYIWDGRTGARIADLPLGAGDQAWDVAFSNDGRLLATASIHGAGLYRLPPGALPGPLVPLVWVSLLATGGADGYALDLAGSPDRGAPMPTGHYDVFGMGGEELACRIGLRRVPVVVCEDRLRVLGLVSLRARGSSVDPLDVDPEP